MRKRGTRPLLATLLVFAAIGGAWVFVQQNRAQKVTLPTGAQLTLIGWSYGKRQSLRMPGEQWWQRLLPLREVYGGKTDTPQFALFYSVPSSTSTSASTQGWRWAEFADEHGNSLCPNALFSQPFYWYHEQAIYAITTENFPRRGKEIRVRFYQDAQHPPASAFRFPNPVTGPFPNWKPQPMPALWQEDSLRVILTRLTLQPYILVHQGAGSITLSEKSQYSPRLANPTGQPIQEIRCPHIEVEFAENGQKSLAWYLSRATLSDATGNILKEAYVEGGNQYTFGGEFCSGEKVGKVWVECYRNDQADFPAAEQRKMNDAVIPEKNKSVRVLGNLTLNGYPAAVYVAGMGEETVAPGTTVGVNTPCVVVHLAAPTKEFINVGAQPEGFQPRLRVTDEQGRLLTEKYRITGETGFKGATYEHKVREYWKGKTIPSTKGWMLATGTIALGHNGGFILFYPLWKATPGTHLHLTFAENKARHAEFTVAMPAR